MKGEEIRDIYRGLSEAKTPVFHPFTMRGYKTGTRQVDKPMKITTAALVDSTG